MEINYTKNTGIKTMSKYAEILLTIWRIIRGIILLAIALPLWLIAIVLILVVEGFSWLLFQMSLLNEWSKLDKLDHYGEIYESGDTLWD
jgi:hypothetical protein